eukprot:Rmarinus@m.19845
MFACVGLVGWATLFGAANRHLLLLCSLLTWNPEHLRSCFRLLSVLCTDSSFFHSFFLSFFMSVCLSGSLSVSPSLPFLLFPSFPRYWAIARILPYVAHWSVGLTAEV